MFLYSVTGHRSTRPTSEAKYQVRKDERQDWKNEKRSAVAVRTGGKVTCSSGGGGVAPHRGIGYKVRCTTPLRAPPPAATTSASHKEQQIPSSSHCLANTADSKQNWIRRLAEGWEGGLHSLFHKSGTLKWNRNHSNRRNFEKVYFSDYCHEQKHPDYMETYSIHSSNSNSEDPLCPLSGNPAKHRFGWRIDIQKIRFDLPTKSLKTYYLPESYGIFASYFE